MAEQISHQNTTVEEVDSDDDTSSLINLSRGERATIAQDTLNILSTGWYQASRSCRINLEEDIEFCVNNSILYEEHDLNNTAKYASTVDETETTSTTGAAACSYPKFEVRHCTTLQAAQSLAEEMGEEHVGVLNFASAKNPGGGFRKGSSAQEESLARSSSLYLALSQDRLFSEFYDYHRRGKDAIYSHRIIYSPRVTIFKDDNGKLLSSPYRVGIVTSPAPNASVVRDQQAIAEAMTERIKRVLCVFKANKHDSLVLGAFGCGVFKNNPLEVAITFRRYLESEMFNHAFKRIIFAVLNPQMCQVFENVFAATDLNHIQRQVAERYPNDGRNQQSKKTKNQRRKENNDYKQARERKYRNYHNDDE